jgi:hypothetical protein
MQLINRKILYGKTDPNSSLRLIDLFVVITSMSLCLLLGATIIPIMSYFTLPMLVIATIASVVFVKTPEDL